MTACKNLRSEVFLYPGIAGWHFVFIPKKQSREIARGFVQKRGFGSIPVVVTIGETRWETSVFPDKKSGGYLLPIKAAVRKKERVVLGAHILFSVEIQHQRKQPLQNGRGAETEKFLKLAHGAIER